MKNIADLAVFGVQKLSPYQPGKPVAELERELGITNIVKLASNENPLGAPTSAVTAMQAVLSDIALYPDGSAFDLKAALAKNLSVATNQITVGNGSNELLDLVARVFLSSENNAVISQYAFLVYSIAVQSVGAELRVAEAKDFGHDLAAMAKLVDKNTRIIFIANPNNPTGTCLSISAIEHFIQSIPGDVIVVLDEAYHEYVTQVGYASGLTLLDRFPNLIVTRTFSKAYGLAGLRVGYCISSTVIADLLNRLREPFNVNALALAAAETVLHDAKYLQNSVETNSTGMKQLEDGLQALGLRFIPSAGNFIAVDFSRDAAFLYQAFLQEGIIVRPIAVYGMPTWLRVSIGLPEQNTRFLNSCRKVLSL